MAVLASKTINLKVIKETINSLLEYMEDEVDSLVMGMDFNESWDELIKFNDWENVEELLEVMAQMDDQLEMCVDVNNMTWLFFDTWTTLSDIVNEMKEVASEV